MYVTVKTETKYRESIFERGFTMKKRKSFKKRLVAYVSIICLLMGLFPTTVLQAASIVSVSICQAGYSADDVKTAVVVVSGGNLSDTNYEIITAGGTKVAGGTMTSYSPSGWSRGETYYKIDFSSFNQTGDFKIRTNGTTSAQFKISENIWTDYTDEMIGMYRIQRCGQDTNQAMNGFNSKPSSEALHAACHTDDAKAGNGQRVDMTGGWHDAGDNNKYGANTGWLIGAIAITYMRHTKADFDNDKNGTPDLLDEVRYGADSMLKILAATGNTGVYDIIDAPNGQQYWWNYPTSESGRIAHSRNAPNPLTYDATMKTAGGLAAVARAFETIDPAYSEKCRNAAISAYKWANSNTGNKGGWYEAKNQNDIRFWAAVQLYKLTSDSTYKSVADSYVNGLSTVSTSTNYWGLEPISLAEYYDVCDTTIKNKILTLLKANSDKWINSMINPFGVSGLDSKCDFGINEPNISNASDTYRLYEITGDTKYRDAAVKAAQWTFGVNPWDISWVVGIGYKYPVRPHTRLDADADKNAGSTITLPGFMICGPIWNDPLSQSNAHPWYEDRSLADDGFNQWKHKIFISIP
jgi:endoglucanase